MKTNACTVKKVAWSKAMDMAVMITLCLGICAAGPCMLERAYAGNDLTAMGLSGAPSWTLSKGNVTLKTYNSATNVYLNGYGSSNYYADSSNYSVVRVGYTYDSGARKYGITLTKAGVGSATVTVHDRNGYTRQLSVNCKPTDFKLPYGKFTFSKKTCYTTRLWVYPSYTNGHAADSVISKAKSSKSSVASVSLRQSGTMTYALVTPKKPGKAKITITDQYNRKKTIKVKVKKSYFKAALNTYTYAHSYYGTKWMTVNTLPNAKVTVKIGNEKHTRKADANGLYTVALNKDYKLGKKIKVTCKAGGAKVKKSFKVTSNTSVSRIGSGSCGTIWSCKYYIPVTVLNVHEGDTISLSAGGYTYSRYVGRNFSSYATTFYTKYRNGCYRSITVTVKNKFGQVVASKYRYLNW